MCIRDRLLSWNLTTATRFFGPFETIGAACSDCRYPYSAAGAESRVDGPVTGGAVAQPATATPMNRIPPNRSRFLIGPPLSMISSGHRLAGGIPLRCALCPVGSLYPRVQHAHRKLPCDVPTDAPS